MKKENYEKPTMEVCKLDMAQPILAGSGPTGSETTEEVVDPA